MIEKIIKELNNLDDSEERQSIDIEVMDKGITYNIIGIVSRQFAETYGGSYLGCRERLSRLISQDLSITELYCYDERGNELTGVNPIDIENQFNNQVI